MIARTTLTLPVYLVVDRRGPGCLPDAVPVTTAIPIDASTEAALVGYRSRLTAASWMAQDGRQWRPLGLRTSDALDRAAAVAVTRYGCRWMALDPGAGAPACVVDLRGWLRERQPWSDALGRFCYRHQLSTALLDAMLDA